MGGGVDAKGEHSSRGEGYNRRFGTNDEVDKEAQDISKNSEGGDYQDYAGTAYASAFSVRGGLTSRDVIRWGRGVI